MNFDSFFAAVRTTNLELKFDRPSQTKAAGLDNEALFHLPLIAITVLLMAGGRRKPKVDELGQLVGECFERTFVGFKGSSQHLGWSANLRVRTVRALTFLESAELASVDKITQRIGATDKGKSVLKAARVGEGDLAYTLAVVERNYRNIGVERQIALEL